MPDEHTAGHDPQFTVGACEIRLTRRSLADLGERVDALVSSDDNYLTHGGGVSRALWDAAGRKHIRGKVNAQRTRWALGDVVVTSAGRLRADYLLHAVTIDFDLRRRIESAELGELYARVFDAAEQRRCTRIGFPVVGSGAARVRADVSAALLSNAIKDRLASPSSIVRIVVSAIEANFPRVEECFETLPSWDGSFAHLKLEASRLLGLLGYQHPRIAEPLAKLVSTEVSAAWSETIASFLGEVQTTCGDPPDDMFDRWAGALRLRNRLAHSTRSLRWTPEVTTFIWTALERIRRELVVPSSGSEALSSSVSPLSRAQPLQSPVTEGAELRGNVVSSGMDLQESPASVAASPTVRPSGNEHVRRLHNLLLSELDSDGRRLLDEHLVALGYEGPPDVRLLEHCVRAEDPADLLANEFTRAKLFTICMKVTGAQPSVAVQSKDLSADILAALGFPTPRSCFGPRQVLEAIQRGRRDVQLRGDAVAAEVVHTLAVQLVRYSYDFCVRQHLRNPQNGDL